MIEHYTLWLKNLTRTIVTTIYNFYQNLIYKPNFPTAFIRRKQIHIILCNNLLYQPRPSCRRPVAKNESLSSRSHMLYKYRLILIVGRHKNWVEFRTYFRRIIFVFHNVLINLIYFIHWNIIEWWFSLIIFTFHCFFMNTNSHRLSEWGCSIYFFIIKMSYPYSLLLSKT